MLQLNFGSKKLTNRHSTNFKLSQGDITEQKTYSAPQG
jgi:hypothetical protein